MCLLLNIVFSSKIHKLYNQQILMVINSLWLLNESLDAAFTVKLKLKMLG